MAGSPKKRAMLEKLELRTREEFSDEPEATHLDYVERWQASGQFASTLALELGVSWEMVKDHLCRTFGREETNSRLSRAREAGGHVLAEETVTLADEADEDNVQVKRLQVQSRQWLAEKWNARELGSKGGASVNINIGALMLDALRQPPPVQAVSAIVDVIALPSQSVSDEDTVTYEVE